MEYKYVYYLGSIHSAIFSCDVCTAFNIVRWLSYSYRFSFWLIQLCAESKTSNHRRSLPRWMSSETASQGHTASDTLFMFEILISNASAQKWVLFYYFFLSSLDLFHVPRWDTVFVLLKTKVNYIRFFFIATFHYGIPFFVWHLAYTCAKVRFVHPFLHRECTCPNISQRVNSTPSTRRVWLT